MRSIAAVLLLLSCLAASAAALVTEVIPTRRDAAELASVLKPLVPAPGSVSSFRNQLIIKTSAGNLAQIRSLLQKLDKAPENLLISVRFSDDAEVRRDLAEAQARLRAGGLSLSSGQGSVAGAGASAGIEGRNGGARVQLRRSTSTSSGNEVHALRVLEGQQAFIRTGQSVPVADQQVTITGFGASVSSGTRFEEFGSGFYVLPRLSGDQVTLEISTQRRRLQGQSNALNNARVQETATRISGRLGRWMEVAGVNSAARRQALGNSSTRLRSSRENNSIFVKVERLGS